MVLLVWMRKFKPPFNFTLEQALPSILLVGSIIGLIASSILTYDQVQLWHNPHYAPDCNLNPLLSCGSVINSQQGHVFGIPAPFLGLVMFAALGAISLTMIAGARFKRWFWRGLQLTMIGGVVFALWLFWLSLYRIHALCPFCLLTDVAVYTMAWYVTLYNLRQHNILKGKRLIRLTEFASKHHLDILIAIFLLITAYILQHFWYYYGKYF